MEGWRAREERDDSGVRGGPDVLPVTLFMFHQVKECSLSQSSKEVKETLACTSKVRRTCLLRPQYNSYYSIPICTYHRAPSKKELCLCLE